VFYETGIAHTVGKVLITQNIEDVPDSSVIFDVLFMNILARNSTIGNKFDKYD
jgi:hypothetical protein